MSGPPRISIFSDERALARALTDRVAVGPRGHADARARPANRPDTGALLRGSFVASRTRRGQPVAGGDIQSRRVRRHHRRASRQLSTIHERPPLQSREPRAASASTFWMARRRTRQKSVRGTSAEIAAAGGIDLQILGLGTNGHIGFNEPAPALEARTHRVTSRSRDSRCQRSVVCGRSGAGSGGSAVDGDCDDSSGAPDRSRCDGNVEGGDRGTSAPRSDHD